VTTKATVGWVVLLVLVEWTTSLPPPPTPVFVVERGDIALTCPASQSASQPVNQSASLALCRLSFLSLSLSFFFICLLFTIY
jgi:hypothetical protein